MVKNNARVSRQEAVKHNEALEWQSLKCTHKWMQVCQHGCLLGIGRATEWG